MAKVKNIKLEKDTVLFVETLPDGTAVEHKINEIIKGNCIEVMKKIPDSSINCIFADPPYFMQSTTTASGKEKKLMRADGTGEFKGCDDEWDKYEDYEAYDDFCNEWLKQCKRILRDDGTIWVIGSFQNIYRFSEYLQIRLHYAKSWFLGIKRYCLV